MILDIIKIIIGALASSVFGATVPKAIEMIKNRKTRGSAVEYSTVSPSNSRKNLRHWLIYGIAFLVFGLMVPRNIHLSEPFAQMNQMVLLLPFIGFMFAGMSFSVVWIAAEELYSAAKKLEDVEAQLKVKSNEEADENN